LVSSWIKNHGFRTNYHHGTKTNMAIISGFKKNASFLLPPSPDDAYFASTSAGYFELMWIPVATSYVYAIIMPQ
jgi:hypothetical protein